MGGWRGQGVHELLELVESPPRPARFLTRMIRSTGLATPASSGHALTDLAASLVLQSSLGSKINERRLNRMAPAPKRGNDYLFDRCGRGSYQNLTNKRLTC